MSAPLILTLVFAGLGLLNTVYLSGHKIRGTLVRCLFFPPEWCEKVQRSKYSKTFGVPNAFAGLGMYLALFVLTWLYWAGLAPFWAIAALVTLGFLFSWYFMGVQAFAIKAFCTWCVASAIDFTALFILLFAL